MRTYLLLGMTLVLAAPSSATAQVSGAIVIGGYPVSGIITIGVPARVVPARRVVIVERHVPAEVIVVERWRPSRHVRHFDYGRYHRRLAWHDRRSGAYYTTARPGLKRVQVYERHGRYYRPGDRDGRYDGERRPGRDR